MRSMGDGHTEVDGGEQDGRRERRDARRGEHVADELATGGSCLGLAEEWSEDCLWPAAHAPSPPGQRGSGLPHRAHKNGVLIFETQPQPGISRA